MLYVPQYISEGDNALKRSTWLKIKPVVTKQFDW